MSRIRWEDVFQGSILGLKQTSVVHPVWGPVLLHGTGGVPPGVFGVILSYGTQQCLLPPAIPQSQVHGPCLQRVGGSGGGGM